MHVCVHVYVCVSVCVCVCGVVCVCVCVCMCICVLPPPSVSEVRPLLMPWVLDPCCHLLWVRVVKVCLLLLSCA